MRPTRPFVCCAFLTLLALSSCGQANRTTEQLSAGSGDRTTWLDGLEVSSRWSMQVLSDERFGPVVIDTAEMTDRRHAVVARWHDGGAVRVVVDSARPSLVFPWAWSAPGRIYVAGLTCPNPSWEDVSVFDEDFAQGCGGHEPFYAIRTLDLSDRSWSEVTPELPLLAGGTVNVLSPGETTMVVGAGSEADPNVQALYRIDLTTGATTPIPEDSDLGRVSGCATSEGNLLSIAAPSGLEEGGRGGRLALLAGDTTEDLETLDGLQVKMACTTNGMLLWDPSTETLTRALVDIRQIRRDDIAMPEPIAGDAFGRLVAQDNLGGTPAVWEDRGTTFQLWRLDDLSWVRTGPTFEGYDPPAVAAVIDDTLVLRSGTSPTTLSVKQR